MLLHSTWSPLFLPMVPTIMQSDSLKQLPKWAPDSFCSPAAKKTYKQISIAMHKLVISLHLMASPLCASSFPSSLSTHCPWLPTLCAKQIGQIVECSSTTCTCRAQVQHPLTLPLTTNHCSPTSKLLMHQHNCQQSLKNFSMRQLMAAAAQAKARCPLQNYYR